MSYSIRIQLRFIVSQEFAEVFVDELRFVAFVHVGSVQIHCWLQKVFDSSTGCVVSV